MAVCKARSAIWKRVYGSGSEKSAKMTLRCPLLETPPREAADASILPAHRPPIVKACPHPPSFTLHVVRAATSNCNSCIYRKRFTEHWVAAFGLILSGLVLNYVPMLDQNPVFDNHNVHSDPVHRCAKARKSAVNDHKIAVRNNDSWLILQRGWNASDEIEQTFAARLDMSTML